jgi:hypothetical protein
MINYFVRYIIVLMTYTLITTFKMKAVGPLRSTDNLLSDYTDSYSGTTNLYFSQLVSAFVIVR